NAFTWHELGLTYRAQGKKPDAVAALERAIQLDPDMSEAYNNLGVIWFGEGSRGELSRPFEMPSGFSRTTPTRTATWAISFLEPAIPSRRAITSRFHFGCGRT